jgi:hypothetical protein
LYCSKPSTRWRLISRLARTCPAIASQLPTRASRARLPKAYCPLKQKVSETVKLEPPITLMSARMNELDSGVPSLVTTPSSVRSSVIGCDVVLVKV